MHRTFHRYCSRRAVNDRALNMTTRDFIGWYRTYPAEKHALQIDDEAGTMPSCRGR